MNASPFRVTFHPSARKQLDGLEPRKVREQIERRINALKNNPMPEGVKKLSQPQDALRVRQGEHRIIYQVRESQIIILRIGHRREVYRR